MKKRKRKKLKNNIKAFLFIFVLILVCLVFALHKKGRKSGSVLSKADIESREHGGGTVIKLTGAPSVTPLDIKPNDPYEVMVKEELPAEYEGVNTVTIKDSYVAEPDTTGLEVIDQTKLGDTSAIKYMKGMTEKGAVVEIINGTTFVNGMLMVNKTYRLPQSYVPVCSRKDLTGVTDSEEGLTDEVWDAWEEMEQAATEDDVTLYISSGYRSYDYQVELFADYARETSSDEADIYSARPGHSEHQSGLCYDLNQVDDSFNDSTAGKWVNDNCWRFGFCIRFPKDKQEYTGYKYEGWHLRYVGKELAEKLYNNGSWISMEEIFGLCSQYCYEYKYTGQ